MGAAARRARRFQGQGADRRAQPDLPPGRRLGIWTGPPSHVTSSRLTAAAIVELIAQARKQLLLVSFATRTEPSIANAPHSAVVRGVEIILVTERQADNPSYTASAVPFPGLQALRLHWPADQREAGAALHAKIIVVDDAIALVGSANLTSRAMETNLECGILLHGAPTPARSAPM